jgi:hypothetical protein
MEDRMYAYNKKNVDAAPATTAQTSEERALNQRRKEMEMLEYLDAQRMYLPVSIPPLLLLTSGTGHHTSMLDIGEQCSCPPQAPLQPEPFVQAQSQLHPTSKALPPAARDRVSDAGALKPSEFKRLSGQVS